MFSKLKKILSNDNYYISDDVTEEEIISMVNEGHEKGVIQSDEVEMINNIFELDEKEAKDIMTPRKNIIGLDGSLSLVEAISFIVENGRSRLPVYENDIDNIIGIIHIKDVLAFALRNELHRTPVKEIESLISEVEFVPETLNINELFKLMQKEKNHLVMVIDEYGQVSGLVAMEDILEEIVGDIEDEHDNEEELIHLHEDGTYLMDGMTAFEDCVETLELPLEPDEFETLNGFLISIMDKIPDEEDIGVINAYGYSFDILSIEDRNIRDVKITKINDNKQNSDDSETCVADNLMIE